MSFYWITRLDASNVTLGIFAAIAGILAVFFTCRYILGDEDDDILSRLKKAMIISYSVFVINILGCSLIPTTKQMCAIYFVEYIQNNEKAQQLPDKIIEAANNYFDDLLKEQNNEKVTD